MEGKQSYFKDIGWFFVKLGEYLGVWEWKNIYRIFLPNPPPSAFLASSYTASSTFFPYFLPFFPPCFVLVPHFAPSFSLFYYFFVFCFLSSTCFFFLPFLFFFCFLFLFLFSFLFWARSPSSSFFCFFVSLGLLAQNSLFIFFSFSFFECQQYT